VGRKKACRRANENGNRMCGDQNCKSLHHFFASSQELESKLPKCLTISSEIEVGHLIWTIYVSPEKIKNKIKSTNT
jgi:hypothetical protein